MTDGPLAMHMANELLSLPVAGVTLAAAGLMVAVAARLASRRLDADRLPLMGVIGAFVFAAQMINFPLPGLPGVSGHLGGAVLLAILLGPSAAVVTMTAILTIQCLLFQDGGLLALGCNVMNMAVVPAVCGHAVYRFVLGRARSVPARRQYVAAYAAALVGVTAGAMLVPFQAHISGVLAVPLLSFLAVMTGVHVVIAAVEGAITFAVIAFVRHTRPAALGLDAPAERAGISRKALGGTILATAVLLACVVSGFAATSPDGLDWSTEKASYAGVTGAVENNSPVVESVEALQSEWTPMSDYWAGWTSLAGLIGTVVTLLAVHATAVVLRRRRLAAAAVES